MKIALICSMLGMLCGTTPTVSGHVAGVTTFSYAPDDATFEPVAGITCKNSGTMTTGYTVYKAVDAANGRCKWVIDHGMMRALAEEEAHRQALWWALRSRPLTDAEMAEVAQMGLFLVIQMGAPYQEDEKMRELSDALLQQFRLRTEAAKLATKPKR